MGVAATEREPEPVSEGPVEIDEAGVALGPAGHQLRVLVGHRRRSRGVEREQPGILRQVILRSEVVPADHVIEGVTDLARCAQFLAELVIFLLALGVVQIGARCVEILRLELGRFAVAGDRRQLHAAQAEVHFQRARRRAVSADGGAVEHRVKVGGGVAVALVGGFERAEQFAGPGEVAVDRIELLAGFFDRQLRVEAAARGLPQHRCAEAVVAAAARRALRNGVVIKPVALVVEVPELGAERVTIADVGDSAAGKGVELAVARFGLEPGLHRRLAATDVDHPADRVGAEQRALRPAQHFDLVDVEKVSQLPGVGAGGDAVNHHAHRRRLRLLDVGIRQPANRQVGRLRARILLGDQQVRRRALQIADVHRGLVLEHRGVDRGDRDGRGLQGFIAAAGRDDDHVGIFAGIADRRIGCCISGRGSRRGLGQRGCRKSGEHCCHRRRGQCRHQRRSREIVSHDILPRSAARPRFQAVAGVFPLGSRHIGAGRCA